MNSLALLRTAILGVCTSLCGLANAADTNAVTTTFVRAFTRLKTDGCDKPALDAFSQALSPVQDREVRAVGCTIYALGSASLGNYQGYLATYKALASAYPASSYLKQLGGSSVSDSCKTCDGTGQAEQTCAGCNGKREFSGFGGVMRNCPRCRGSGTMVAKCTTCQGRRQVFSPERAGETLKAFLETAETTLASTYGPLGNYLPEQKRTQPAGQEAAGGTSHATSSSANTAMAPPKRQELTDRERHLTGTKMIKDYIEHGDLTTGGYVQFLSKIEELVPDKSLRAIMYSTGRARAGITAHWELAVAAGYAAVNAALQVQLAVAERGKTGAELEAMYKKFMRGLSEGEKAEVAAQNAGYNQTAISYLLDKAEPWIKSHGDSAMVEQPIARQLMALQNYFDSIGEAAEK